MATGTQKAKYQCSRCGAEFNSEEDLRAHKKKDHEQNQKDERHGSLHLDPAYNPLPAAQSGESFKGF